MKPTSSHQPPGRARLGIFGGTFNPVHNGHVIMAVSAVEQANLERLHVIPNRTPPHKAAPSLAAPDQRLKLLRLAFEGVPSVHIDSREMDAESELSYSVLTLESLRTEYPEHELCFIVGADSVASLPTWYKAERVTQLATFLWIARPGVADDFLDTTQDQLPHLAAEQLAMPQVDISSTDIRERIRTQRCLKGRVPDAIIPQLESMRPE